ncbi:MAG: phage tail protein [Acidimicrobiales bacterium]
MQHFVGEIRLFAGQRPPAGWLKCEGQRLPIKQFPRLYEVIGGTYGQTGDAFSLPDLRGRVPIHRGESAGGVYQMGSTGGTETATLRLEELPAHTHLARCHDAAGNVRSVKDNYWAAYRGGQEYMNATPTTPFAIDAVSKTGSGQSHNNTMPYLALNFIIACDGDVPA